MLASLARAYRRQSSRICARLDRPHPRLRRTGRRNATRLALWPLAAVWVVVTMLGFRHPEAFSDPSGAPDGAATPPAAATGPTPTPPAECDWHDELNDTIRELGSNRAVWSVVPPDEVPHGYDAYVEYDHGTVKISDELPCDTVADVARHEWMHIQQVRLHGGREAIREAYGDRDEIVADCGSHLLGSEVTPYRDRAAERRGVACTARDLADAAELIDHPSFADEARRSE